MSSRGLFEEAFVSFCRTCKTHDIPSDPMHAVMAESARLYGTNWSKRADFLHQKTYELAASYPYVTSELFLKRIHESEDWEHLSSTKSCYWQDVPSLLMDAAKLGFSNVVAQLAPHYLFQTPFLQEIFTLTRDPGTRQVIFSVLNFRNDGLYRRYPFCVAMNQIESIRMDIYTNHHYFLSLPADAQEVVRARFLDQVIHGTEQDFFDYMNNALPPYKSHRIKIHPELMRFQMYAMGYSLTPDTLEKRPIPECWLTEEHTFHHHTSEQRIASGISALLGLMSSLGWEFEFEGTDTFFGHTGYSYLKNWP